jgi:uncharacterized CHY-type Zn-finger protein
MGMSAEARAAASERMKAMLAKKREKKSAVDPALQEAMAKQPIRSAANEKGIDTEAYGGLPGEVTVYPAGKIPRNIPMSSIDIKVDWEHIDMPSAQQFYAHLKAEFEKAGKILNDRENKRNAGYTCFTCKKYFEGLPHYVDFSYIDPITGLNILVTCCRNELCSREYNEMRIRERTKENLRRAAEQRGE